MAEYRSLQTEFWSDNFIGELTPEERYFYIYIMTNPRVTQCGIYEIPLRFAEVETGYNRETLTKLINRFVEYKKLLYSPKTNEILIINWLRHNKINSMPMKKCIEKELTKIKDQFLIKEFMNLVIKNNTAKELIPVLPQNNTSMQLSPKSTESVVSSEENSDNMIPTECGIDGISIPIVGGIEGACIPLGEKEKEKEKEKDLNTIVDEPEKNTENKFSVEPIPYKQIMHEYNTRCSKLPNIRDIQGGRQKHVRACWRQNPNIDYFISLFEETNKSDFLTGQNDRAWVANFDWILNPSSRVKILEGNYKNKSPVVSAKKNENGRLPNYANFDQREYSEEDLEQFYCKVCEN